MGARISIETVASQPVAVVRRRVRPAEIKTAFRGSLD
jgi:hypothetical protein